MTKNIIAKAICNGTLYTWFGDKCNQTIVKLKDGRWHHLKEKSQTYDHVPKPKRGTIHK